MRDDVSTEPRRSLSSLVLLAACISIVLGAMHVAAEVVTPVLLAMVLAFIFWPLYQWLRGRGLGTLPALVVFLVGLAVGIGLFGLVFANSIGGLANRLVQYSDQLSARLQSLDEQLSSAGLTGVDLASALPPDMILGTFAVVVSGLAGALSRGFFVVLLLLFFLVEGPSLGDRLRASLGANDPNPARVMAFGRDVGQYFALRAAVNAVTGAGVAIVLWLLGVDFPLLWGVLTFFLSFVPYIGMFVASVPSVLLAWAEYDLAHAVVVALALTIVNAAAENLLQPALMHKGLNLSPTFVVISVFFWGWLLPGGGSFLAIPLSLGLLAVLANFAAANWFVDTVTTRSDVRAVSRAPEDTAAVPDVNG